MVRWDIRLCPKVGQGSRLGFTIMQAIGCVLPLVEVSGLALWLGRAFKWTPQLSESGRLAVRQGCMLGSTAWWDCRLGSACGWYHCHYVLSVKTTWGRSTLDMQQKWEMILYCCNPRRPWGSLWPLCNLIKAEWCRVLFYSLDVVLEVWPFLFS